MAERKLLDQVRDEARLRHLSLRTEETYCGWIRRFILFHRKRHPREMNAAQITEFLTHLAVNGRVAASTQNQALNALVFLYKQVLKINLEKISDVVRAPQRRKLPVVLTREETDAVLTHLSQESRLLASLLYGSGLRLMEAVRLRVKDIDLARGEILVRDGKGEISPADLLIRTAGEKRTSDIGWLNGAPTELHFMDKYFPEVTISDIVDALVDFSKRERRMGARK